MELTDEQMQKDRKAFARFDEQVGYRTPGRYMRWIIWKATLAHARKEQAEQIASLQSQNKRLREALVDADTRLRDFLELLALKCSDVADEELTHRDFFEIIESRMQDVYVGHINSKHFAVIKDALSTTEAVTSEKEKEI